MAGQQTGTTRQSRFCVWVVTNMGDDTTSCHCYCIDDYHTHNFVEFCCCLHIITMSDTGHRTPVWRYLPGFTVHHHASTTTTTHLLGLLEEAIAVCCGNARGVRWHRLHVQGKTWCVCVETDQRRRRAKIQHFDSCARTDEQS